MALSLSLSLTKFIYIYIYIYIYIISIYTYICIISITNNNIFCYHTAWQKTSGRHLQRARVVEAAAHEAQQPGPAVLRLQPAPPRRLRRPQQRRHPPARRQAIKWFGNLTQRQSIKWFETCWISELLRSSPPTPAAATSPACTTQWWFNFIMILWCIIQQRMLWCMKKNRTVYNL